MKHREELWEDAHDAKAKEEEEADTKEMEAPLGHSWGKRG